MLTITSRTGDYYGDASSNHIWETRNNDGALIAELYVSTDRHEIMNIWVNPDHRGEGHARALYEAATAQTEVFHAPTAHRTPEGNAFAEAVGGETVDPYPCDCYTCDSLED
ncbi:GNAT family N-acetyltransferase [Streptomyces sp. NPDC001276]|uniref:GNAT family N-acetyltransferase n=1 Tax=Streptomyces sp. NPDC001276 TaxID=3364555 RepID=UPI0036B2870E